MNELPQYFRVANIQEQAPVQDCLTPSRESLETMGTFNSNSTVLFHMTQSR